jgi:hypothetical protein
MNSGTVAATAAAVAVDTARRRRVDIRKPPRWAY